MANFLRIGDHVVNEDHIVKVELKIELEDFLVAAIHLTRGDHITLQGDEAAALRSYFEAHATNIISWYARMPKA